jgi:MoxR-like ATPase
MVRLSLGYPSSADEAAMLAEHAAGDRVLELGPVSTVAEIVAVQDGLGAIHASEPLRRYVVALADATRRDPRTQLGASPRAALMLLQAATVQAALEGREHVLPDDVQGLAHDVLGHRLLLSPGLAETARREIVDDALASVEAL